LVGTDGTLFLDAGTDLRRDLGPDSAPDAPPDLAVDSVDAIPLPTGLVAYYPCESANGVVLPDQSGNGNDATLSIGLPHQRRHGAVGNWLSIRGGEGRQCPDAAQGRLWLRIHAAVDLQRSDRESPSRSGSR
jgi:hypothetical protein